MLTLNSQTNYKKNSMNYTKYRAIAFNVKNFAHPLKKICTNI